MSTSRHRGAVPEPVGRFVDVLCTPTAHFRDEPEGPFELVRYLDALCDEAVRFREATSPAEAAEAFDAATAARRLHRLTAIRDRFVLDAGKAGWQPHDADERAEEAMFAACYLSLVIVTFPARFPRPRCRECHNVPLVDDAIDLAQEAANRVYAVARYIADSGGPKDTAQPARQPSAEQLRRTILERIRVTPPGDSTHRTPIGRAALDQVRAHIRDLEEANSALAAAGLPEELLPDIDPERWRHLMRVVGGDPSPPATYGDVLDRALAWLDRVRGEELIRKRVRHQQPKTPLTEAQRQTPKKSSSPMGAPPRVPARDRPRVIELTEGLLKEDHPLRMVPTLLKEKHGINVSLTTLKRYRRDHQQKQRSQGSP
jgi:hypothetical protein